MSNVCTQRPFCNESLNDTIGYCPDFGTCYEGACFTLFGQSIGEQCVSPTNCEPGLACLNATSTISTCQRVSLGTVCETDYDCEFFSQECLCEEPDDSVPLVCTDSGGYMCKKEALDFAICLISENCYIYDINDVTTSCSQKCLPLQNILTCCQTCLYPQYADNAYFNIVGSCANDNVTTVNCCSTTPCTILPTDQMCAGYF
jgi:hypothetical protein